MEAIGTVTAIIYWLSATVTLLYLHFIKLYHENKPFGMETPLSRVVILFTNVSSYCTVVIAITFSTSAMLPSMSHMLAMSLSIFQFISYYHFYMVLLAMSITKYASIYHSHFMEDIDEEVSLQIINRIVVMSPLFMGYLEFNACTKLEDTVLYCLLTLENQDQCSSENIGYFLPSLIFVNFVFIVILQSRIEYDQMKSKEGNLSILGKLKRFFRVNKTGNQNQATTGYSLSVPRVMVCLGGFLVTMLVIQLASKRLSFQVNNLIFFVTFGNICTPIFIFTHKGLRQHTRKVLRKWLSYFYPSQIA